jgi:hypothetical protein
VLVLVLATSASVPACTPRARLCTATSECSAASSCVAGRCQPERPGTRPTIEAARRLVFRPVDVGYVTRRATDPARGVLAADDGAPLPPHAVLGRDGAALLLRFAADVPPGAKVEEAYVVLRRATAVDDDPCLTVLHATRIVAPWNGRSTTFARQPRLEDIGAPATPVEPGGPTLVRLDVLAIVRLWARRDPSDEGIAIVGASEGAARDSGTTFALLASAGSTGGEAPYLELYVR